MIVISIRDIIAFVIIGIAIVGSIVIGIINRIKKIGKKNCYKCKHYDLYDVASCGDSYRYKCNKHNRIDDSVSMNEEEHYERCENYIKK